MNIMFTSDDMALTKETNEAIAEGIKYGTLKSATILANGIYYNHAAETIQNLLNEGFEIDLGIHLNVIEGKSLTKNTLLTDEKGFFNLSYFDLIINSFNKKFMKEIEIEFRAQIEKVILDFHQIDIAPTHLDSHVHTHAIPNIFKLCTKLAHEYGIRNIRVQNEHIYASNGKMPKLINLIKILLLKFFTFFNKFQAKKMKLNFNDYIIGVGYTGEMTERTIIDGLIALPINKSCEILIHPEKNSQNPARVREYKSITDFTLIEYLKNLNVIKWSELERTQQEEQ